jgi:trehalose 6-phosphate synthase
MASTVEGVSQQDASPQLVVVANRLPVRRTEDDDGNQVWTTSPGGLVSALTPALAAANRGAWVGWAGTIGPLDDPTEPALEVPDEIDGIGLIDIPISAEELADHYDGMSNGTLWPLYHDKIGTVEFHRHWYDGYRRINHRFAVATSKVADQGATVWIHDYQLQLVPGMLKDMRPDLTIGYFLHIPFPPRELFQQLPWRSALADGILGADLIGFQTPQAISNFRGVAEHLGRATVVDDNHLDVAGRTVVTRSYPIGIDVDRYQDATASHRIIEASRDLRARLGNPRTVLLGVDRLDYTKGIDVRLRAFRELLADGVLHPSEVTMVQVAEPSRDNVDAYVDIRNQVERLVSEINGDYGRVGFPVVHYIHQSQSFDELMALYRTADVMLVTPFADGMNLVAKEYVASRYDELGVLVLSEFAGAAHQLTEAILVNPYDIDGLKTAIADSVNMAIDEQRSRLTELRRVVAESDVNQWLADFLRDLQATSRDH